MKTIIKTAALWFCITIIVGGSFLLLASVAHASSPATATYEGSTIASHTHGCKHAFITDRTWAKETITCRNGRPFHRMTFILHKQHGRWVTEELVTGKVPEQFGCEIEHVPAEALGLECSGGLGPEGMTSEEETSHREVERHNRELHCAPGEVINTEGPEAECQP